MDGVGGWMGLDGCPARGPHLHSRDAGQSW